MAGVCGSDATQVIVCRAVSDHGDR